MEQAARNATDEEGGLRSVCSHQRARLIGGAGRSLLRYYARAA